MSSPVDHEARGDWAGIKGTEYHLVYAIWFLLHNGDVQVAFYQGNDLLANPISPPPPRTPADDEPLISFHSRGAHDDVWVQLKATATPWSVRSFLPKLTQEDNLLKNFICNAFQSQQAGRQWRVELVTQGPVRRHEVEAFVANPVDPELNGRLIEIVDRAAQHIEQSLPEGTVVDKSQLYQLALAVLRQLAQTQPKNLDTLKAEIITELTGRCYDKGLATNIAYALRGALLEDAAGGPGADRIYDITWLSEKANFPLNSTALFDRDPVAACNEAVNRVLPRGWEPQQHVPRLRLDGAFQQFLAAPETLFVLVGASGRGKSWAAADCAVRLLAGRARLFVPGTTLDHHRTLSGIVAEFVRPFTAVADWSDEQLLRRLKAAADAAGRGPLVVVIDDLLVPARDVDVFMRDLAALVAQCREQHIKLIVTCQQQTWELYRLGNLLPARELFQFDEGFSFDAQAKRPHSTFSFLLSELTADELTDVVRRRLQGPRADRAALLLRTTPFTSLRNPYLLTQYLDQYGEHLGEQDKESAPVAVDELLDGRVEKVLRGAARVCKLTLDDLRPAFDALVRELWPARPNGLTYTQAVSSLRVYLGEQSRDFIAALRQAGLVTAEGSINLAEPPVADRLFARHLAERLNRHEVIIGELRPETDSGVVAALMRGVVTSPVDFAETLLSRDIRWRRAITEGLAQCTPDDYRVLAMVSVLMGSDPKHWIVSEAGEAMGQLAARGRRAWRQVVEMYFSERPVERHRGEYALAVAMEFLPLQVGAAIRLKLSRAAKVDDFFSKDRERRAQLLAGALEPLRLIKHKKAADVGRRLVERYEHLAGRSEHNLNYDYLEEVDRARGRVALNGNIGELDALIAELTSDDPRKRYRAAVALRGPAIERPELVKNALCAALRREEEYARTVNRLLLAAYPLITADPALLLETLRTSGLTRWNRPLQSTGQVLGLLGDLASKYPDDVFQLLPRRLDAYPPYARAFLSEMLSYAWWRCAEHVGAGAPHLTALAEVDLTDVPEECIPFAYRGAAIAQLGSICIGRESAAELSGEQIFYPYWDLRFAYINTRRFIERRAAYLLAHPGYERLQEYLLRCVVEEARVQAHPINKRLAQSQFRSAVLCLEMLAQCTGVSPNPLPIINALPHDWQALHLARLLLDEGHKGQGLIEFARREADERGRGTTSFQALHERELCLAQLALLEVDPHAGLVWHRAALGADPLRTTGRALGLARLLDANPDETLSLLGEGVKDKDDVPTLYHLAVETRSWRVWLIARLYARMFDVTPIDVNEAKTWCEQVLIAVRDLPESTYRQEYETVYQTIYDWLNGAVNPAPVPPSPESLIQQSHALAIAILARAFEAVSQNEGSAWLEEMLSNRHGWIDSNHELRDGAFTFAFRPYRNYVFPAVRLAAVAVGARHGLSDPAARMLAERKLVKELLDEHNRAFDDPSEAEDEQGSFGRRMETAAAAFEQQLGRTPRDETLWRSYGGLLLRLDRLTDAEAALRTCLALPSSGEDTRGSALYDLACVQARTGREEECRAALEELDRLGAFDRRHAATDPDLTAVRDRVWFQALLGIEAEGERVV